MKILFIGSRLYDDIDWYVKEKGIESVLTESNEEAINLDLPDQVFIVPRGMDGPKQVALMQKVDAIVPLIGIDPPLIDVAHMKKYQILNSPDELTLDFPVVLKQGEGQGGKDIKIAKSIEDVEEYFNQFSQALCEEFIEGSEISIEVLGYGGEYVALPPIYKGETTIEGTHPLNKVKTGPCMVEGLDNNLVQHTAYKVAKNLDSDGIFEMDFMYSKQKDQLYAIEVNTRPNGTRYLTTATCGINSLCELVNMAIGEFSLADISDRLEYHYSTEIPVGNYGGPSPKEPVKSFAYNDFVVHGPEGYQRVTARANSKKDLENLVEKLM